MSSILPKEDKLKLNFSGKTVVITGATRGIGKQVAQDIESLGGRLLLTGTNENEIDQLNQDAINMGRRVKYFVADFSNEEGLHSFLDELDCYDDIAVCVNNAGVNPLNSLEEIRDDDWTKIVSVNVTAPLYLTKLVAGKMRKNSYGRIVNISSIWGTVSKARRILYSVTKHGIQGLTTTSAIELAQHNILVNSVSPGFVDTELTRRNLSSGEIENLKEKIPLGRLATKEEISKAIIFLASDLNTYITGQNLIVDGGFVNA